MLVDTFRVMTNHPIISEVQRYADQLNIPPERVCRDATNNPRLWDRLKRRVDTIEADAEKLRSHMAANPAKATPSSHSHDAESVADAVNDTPQGVGAT